MDRSELMTLTVKVLRTKAEELGVKRITSLKKNDLVDAILNASGNDSETENYVNNNDVADVEESDSMDVVDSVNDETDSVDPASFANNSVKSDAKSADANIDKIKTINAKSDKKASDADADNSDDDADKKDVKSDKLKTANDSEKKEAEIEPAPVEPSSIFIDHGAILPEYVPGTCLYALVRDPGTLFVYWNATFESNNGWLLTAYDAAGNELQSFTTPARRNGRGYFRIPTARVARVTLSVVTGYGNSEVKLESRIKIAQQLGIVQPAPKFDERWVDVQNHEVVYEAPAPGRAPAFQEVYQSMTNQMTGGGFDRALEAHNGSMTSPNQTGSTSSRFGSLNHPGSSDTLVATSSSLIRR